MSSAGTVALHDPRARCPAIAGRSDVGGVDAGMCHDAVVRHDRADAEEWRHLPDPGRVDIAVDGLRMLADPTRFRLLWLLCGDDLDVGTLAERLEVARPAVSQHLAKLRMLGLVSQRRDGRRMLYRARDSHVGRLLREAVRDADHRGEDSRPGHHHADPGAAS